MKQLNLYNRGQNQTSVITEAYRCGLADVVLAGIISKVIETSNNYTRVDDYSGTNSSSRPYRRVTIDVGATRFYIYFQYTSKSASTGTQSFEFSFGICSKEDTQSLNYIYNESIETRTISVEQSNVTIDGTKYYYGSISISFWYFTKRNKLIGFTNLSKDEPTNVNFFVLGEDISGEEYILFYNTNNPALYYLSDESLTRYTIDGTTRKFATDGYVLTENIPIQSSSGVVRSITTDDFMKVHCDELNTTSAIAGTRIALNEKIYRKMYYSYFLLNEES